MDQQVGLRTQALNYERVVAADPSVSVDWIPVRYESGGGLLSRLPGMPSGFKGTLRGVSEIRRGLRDARRYDAILWATWAAKSVIGLVATSPAFLVMDMTPRQMEAMGEQYGYSRSRARILGGWKKRATERLYRQAAHLFPWNEWVAQSLREDYGVPTEKITTISPGVDIDLYKPAPAAKPNDGIVRVLFVGGDFKRKGGDLLLRWTRETRYSKPWELHIVTRDEVPDHPGIVVHRNLGNNSPELVRLYQQSDLFVLPTRADCYSLVALEAMACGLPVVITRLGGIPEIIEEGKTGYLIDIGDFGALKACLDSLLQDPSLRQGMGESARHRIVALFNCKSNLEKVLGVMKSGAKPHVARSAA